MKPDGSKTGLVESFSYALQGLEVVARGRNFRIQAAVGAAAIVLGFVFGISATEWIVIIACIGVVLGFECVNTAIEEAIDLGCPRRDPRAKLGKDAGAGAVLIVSLAALAVGMIVFLPRIVGVLMP